jgi:hypothetical protein
MKVKGFVEKHPSFVKGFKQGLLIACIILPATPIMKVLRITLILIG